MLRPASAAPYPDGWFGSRASLAEEHVTGPCLPVTPALPCPKRGRVSRVFCLFLMLIASSLVTTWTVHAREFSGLTTIECNGAVHSEGDADQSQGDTDKAIPHHHGTCHGSSLDAPAGGTLTPMARTDGLRPFPAPTSSFTSRLVDPALRPPAA